MKLYRFASAAPPSWNLTKSILLVTGFWLLFLVLAPWQVARLNRHAFFAILLFKPQVEAALVIFLASALIGLWAVVTVARLGQGTPMIFDAPRKLVVGGPYAWMRNPLLAAGIGQGIAAALYTGALLILPCVVAGIVAIQIVVWRLETPELERAFGREFEAYRRNVRYWLPMRRPWLPHRSDGRPVSLDEIDLTPRRRRQSN